MSKYSNRKYKCNGDRFDTPYPLVFLIVLPSLAVGIFLGYMLHLGLSNV